MTTQAIERPLSHDRHTRITGSRIAGVLNLSPYITRAEVLREMVREYEWAEPEFTGNFVTEYGKDHESDAIDEYEVSRGLVVAARGGNQVTLIHPGIEFFAYTPDGLVGEDGMVEAKCPWRSPYTHIDQRPDYEAQIRLGLEVFDRDWCDFLVWRHEGMTVSRVQRDPAWLEGVYDELERFNDELLTILADPEKTAPFLEPLVDQRTDEAWQMAALEYLEARWATDVAEQAQAAAKAKLTALANGKTSKGFGVHAIRTKGGGGTVSYRKALEKYAPEADLEPFRGAPGAPGWTVRKTGDKS